MRHCIDIVQIISWNGKSFRALELWLDMRIFLDYGESHYIGPIKGAQPDSQAWVDGYPHNAWLKLTAYFSRAYKEGRYPLIDKDQIFAWARPHPCHAVASDDPVPRPKHANLVIQFVSKSSPTLTASNRPTTSCGWLCLQRLLLRFQCTGKEMSRKSK